MKNQSKGPFPLILIGCALSQIRCRQDPPPDLYFDPPSAPTLSRPTSDPTYTSPDIETIAKYPPTAPWDDYRAISFGIALSLEEDKQRQNYPPIDGFPPDLDIGTPMVKSNSQGGHHAYPIRNDFGYIITSHNVGEKGKFRDRSLEFIYTVEYRPRPYKELGEWSIDFVSMELFDDGSGPRYTFEKNGEYWIRKSASSGKRSDFPMPQDAPKPKWSAKHLVEKAIGKDLYYVSQDSSLKYTAVTSRHNGTTVEISPPIYVGKDIAEIFPTDETHGYALTHHYLMQDGEQGSIVMVFHGLEWTLIQRDPETDTPTWGFVVTSREINPEKDGVYQLDFVQNGDKYWRLIDNYSPQP